MASEQRQEHQTGIRWLWLQVPCVSMGEHWATRNRRMRSVCKALWLSEQWTNSAVPLNIRAWCNEPSWFGSACKYCNQNSTLQQAARCALQREAGCQAPH